MSTAGDHETRDPGRVQSVDRAIDILAQLARDGWSGVTEVGESLGVHKSTASRLLTTLEARGLVEQHPDSGQYHLGFGLVHLARGVIVGPDIAGRARSDCEWLAEHTDETVTLSIMEAEQCVTIDQIISSSSIVSRSWLGRGTPLHCTSPGKVFLAHLPDRQRTELVKGPHTRYTEHTIVNAGRLRKLLKRVRTDGFATTLEEFEEGLSSVAAPVFAADGRVVATIEVSGPSYRLGTKELDEFAPVVREAAQQASTRFAYSNTDTE
jgi:DNA-binding IclR family transcriptional regulator